MPDFKASLTQNGVAVSLTGHTHTWTIPRGTSFPGSPAQYDLFQRTDLGEICEWDGSAWLGRKQNLALSPWSNGPPWASTIWSHVLPLGYSIRISSFSYVGQLSTGNNATNYWTIALYNSGTLLYTSNTMSRGGTSAFVNTDNTPVVATLPTYLYLSLTKTLSAGSIYIAPTMEYRRIYA